MNHRHCLVLKRTFLRKAKYYCKIFCSKDHGLKHLFIRSGVMGLYWTLSFVLVYITTVYMMTKVILVFRQYPLVTKIKIEGNQFQFPDVTICPKSPFGDLMSPNFQVELEKLTNTTRKTLLQASVKITQETMQAGLLLQLLKHDDTYSPRLHLHIIYCKYNNEDCSFYNFSEIIHPRYIKCYEFQPKKRGLRTGSGLTLVYYTAERRPPFMLLNDLEDLTFFHSAAYDGINVLVHQPLTFPSYEISLLPTSFPLRYGTLASLEVRSLKYKSNRNPSKPCHENPPTFKYTNFRGDSKFLEYNYTHEDCLGTKKQAFIRRTCHCFSDKLFVPYDFAAASPPRLADFCRYIPGKTSEEIRNNFFCHEIQSALSSSEILDKYVLAKDLLLYKDDPDKLRRLRLQICMMTCFKDIYDTKLYSVEDISELSIDATNFGDYLRKLRQGQFRNDEFTQLFAHNQSINASNLIIFEIRTASETSDEWQEERSSSILNLLCEIGGIFNLCPGISALMCIILTFYFLLCVGSFGLHVFVNYCTNVVCNERLQDTSNLRTTNSWEFDRLPNSENRLYLHQTSSSSTYEKPTLKIRESRDYGSDKDSSSFNEDPLKIHSNPPNIPKTKKKSKRSTKLDNTFQERSDSKSEDKHKRKYENTLNASEPVKRQISPSVKQTSMISDSSETKKDKTQRKKKDKKTKKSESKSSRKKSKSNSDLENLSPSVKQTSMISDSSETKKDKKQRKKKDKKMKKSESKSSRKKSKSNSDLEDLSPSVKQTSMISDSSETKKDKTQRKKKDKKMKKSESKSSRKKSKSNSDLEDLSPSVKQTSMISDSSETKKDKKQRKKKDKKMKKSESKSSRKKSKSNSDLEDLDMSAIDALRLMENTSPLNQIDQVNVPNQDSWSRRVKSWKIKHVSD